MCSTKVQYKLILTTDNKIPLSVIGAAHPWLIYMPDIARGLSYN